MGWKVHNSVKLLETAHNQRSEIIFGDLEFREI